MAINRFVCLLVLLISNYIFCQGGFGSDTAKIIYNGKIRFGNGTEVSTNNKGILVQPWYFSEVADNFLKLTYTSGSNAYPLDNTFALGGDGTDSWNVSGTLSENPTFNNIEYNTTNWTVIAGTPTKGYGTITVSGTITETSVSYSKPPCLEKIGWYAKSVLDTIQR